MCVSFLKLEVRILSSILSLKKFMKINYSLSSQHFEVRPKNLKKLKFWKMVEYFFVLFRGLNIIHARFKIWTRSILILALLHRTQIFQRNCEVHRPKQFLDVLRRCANPRNLIFFHFCGMKMTLCSEFFKFKDLQKQN